MKGNLYLHLIRNENPRISILASLKYEYKSTPRNYKKINKLKKDLSKLTLKENNTKPKTYMSIFNGKYVK